MMKPTQQKRTGSKSTNSDENATNLNKFEDEFTLNTEENETTYLPPQGELAYFLDENNNEQTATVIKSNR